MTSKATTVSAYLKELPDERREVVSAVRKVILENLPVGLQEAMQYGGIGYSVPHSTYPAGYHCDPKQPLPFAGLAAQKHHYGVYMFCIYCDPKLTEWFVAEYKKTGKRMDIGKGCVRFRKLEDLPLELIGKTFKKMTVKKFIEMYEAGKPAKKK